MPSRTVPLVNGEYYHVFNRGVAYLPTYKRIRDYERFVFSLSYYQHINIPCKISRLLQLPADDREQILVNLEQENDRIIKIISYALMPNHFHLLVRQEKDKGISSSIKHLTDSYTRYFNTKYERVGPLYQGAFKAVRIETDEQLIHVSRYIHLNPLVSYVVNEKEFLSYPWSSMKQYMNPSSSIVYPDPVLAHFKSTDDYLTFVLDQADYGKELEKIKHLTIEKE